MRFVGFSPPWGDLVERSQDRTVKRWLVLPLWLWEAAFYHTRPNNVDKKILKPQWTVLRSQKRYLQALFAYVGPPSHMLWNIKYTLAMMMAVGVGVTLYGYYDVEPEMDSAGVFMRYYRNSIFAISLFLSLRISRAYDRWWQARQAMGTATGSATKLVMQATSYFTDLWMLDELARWVKVWHYTIYGMVTMQPRQIMPETRELLDAEEWAVYEAAPTRRQVPWLKMQQLLAAADLPDGQALLMDTWLQRCDAEADACARFRSTALPYNLTLLSTGFIQIWIMLLPIGYIQEGDWWTLFPYFWLALLLLACDELATQLEDPFTFLPCLDILTVQVRDVQKVIVDGIALQKIADRPKAAMGYVSDRQVDPDEIELPLLPKEAVTVAGLL